MLSPSARVLIIKLSSIGDVVHALPVAAALRRHYPQSYLAWAVKPAAAELLAGNPHLTEVLVIGGRGSAPGLESLPPLTHPFALRGALRSRRFEVAVDMQGLFKSALLTALSGARERVGFRNAQEGTFLFYNRRVVPDRKDVHAVEGYFGFAAALEAPVEPVEFAIAVTDADRQHAEALVRGHDRVVALVPGARWSSKQWPAERFAAVAEALHRDFGCTAAVVGGPGDGALAARVGAATSAPVLDLTGRTTLKQLAALFDRGLLTIANDTGPMHISAAVGTPTVAIFGPTDPARLGPYGPGHATVCARVSCAPCRRRECASRQCLGQITVEQVLAAARALLAARAGREAHGA